MPITGTQAPPKSLGGLKNFAMKSVGTATWGLGVLLGLGILAWSLPHAGKVPVAGPLIRQGMSLLPLRQGATTDGYGTRRR